jgi:tetratricopeptide (TPR) repeat protein
MFLRGEAGWCKLLRAGTCAWQTVPCLLALALLTPAAPPAQAEKEWIGRRVLPKFKSFALRNSAPVDRQNLIRFYRVERAQATSLRLRAEGQPLSGWASDDQVVLADKAVEFFSNQIRTNPRDAFSLGLRATLYLEKDKLDLSLTDCDEAIRLDPAQPWVFSTRGLVWSAKREFDKAIADFNDAIRLGLRDAGVYRGRAAAWYIKKEYVQAIVDYSMAISLDPEDPRTYNDRGAAWLERRGHADAAADFNEAIRLDPKNADAYTYRAWIWAICPDPKCRDGRRAVESAKKACELTHWKSSGYINVLAAACAEAGDFESAVSWQSKANALGLNPNNKAAGEARLRLYQQRKPCRDEMP